MRNLFSGWLIASALLVGCATIQAYERIVQPVDSELSTHIGGAVFRIERSSDLPNAFGNADVWGGKVDRGFVELRYQGVTADGKLVFRFTDFETRSNETTMSRYGLRHSTVNATTTISPTGNNANIFGSVITVAPRGRTQFLSPNTTEFTFDVNKTKILKMGEIKVRVIDFNEQSLRYTLFR